MDKATVEALKATNQPASEDKLDRLRGAVRLALDLQLEISDLEQRVKEKKKSLLDIQQRQLVDLFDEAKVERVDLPRDGNVPPFVARLHPYYQANIPVDWGEERRAAAFQWLEANGHGDLIRTQIVVDVDRKDRTRAQALARLLEDHGFIFSQRLGVHWGTYTAWAKEQLEKFQRVLPLERLGVTAGRVVELKETKEK